MAALQGSRAPRRQALGPGGHRDAVGLRPDRPGVVGPTGRAVRGLRLVRTPAPGGVHGAHPDAPGLLSGPLRRRLLFHRARDGGLEPQGGRGRGHGACGLRCPLRRHRRPPRRRRPRPPRCCRSSSRCPSPHRLRRSVPALWAGRSPPPSASRPAWWSGPPRGTTTSAAAWRRRSRPSPAWPTRGRGARPIAEGRSGGHVRAGASAQPVLRRRPTLRRGPRRARWRSPSSWAGSSGLPATPRSWATGNGRRSRSRRGRSPKRSQTRSTRRRT